MSLHFPLPFLYIFAPKNQALDTKNQPNYISFKQTGKFTKIVLDYIDAVPELKEFYEHEVDLEGIKAAIEARKAFDTNRRLLVDQFERQYKDQNGCEVVKTNMYQLLDENTFTICTAHQPNIFTGHLYFIYKILHIIKISDSLKIKMPEYNFVPVFFMGSEDADLAELNHIVIDGQNYEWKTKQTGAVGRMKVDNDLLILIDAISGRLKVEKYGNSIISLMRACFTKGRTIEEATFLFVHELFKEFGLLILLPDNAAYKKEMLSIFEDDIFNHTSSKIVNETSEKLAKNFKAQAYPREINLFYLKDNLRNRIVQVDDHYVVHDTDIVFSKEEIRNELQSHPERFSPNVVLRGLFQEFILPDVAWIGGGGELAYWLQLKDLFKHYSVPYPMLVVRNSFLIIDEKCSQLLIKLNLNPADLFKGQENLLNEIVKNESKSQLNLAPEIQQFREVYDKIKVLASAVDTTLSQHAAALETKHLKTLSALEKKMLRAEKRKFETQKNQLRKYSRRYFLIMGCRKEPKILCCFIQNWVMIF